MNWLLAALACIAVACVVLYIWLYGRQEPPKKIREYYLIGAFPTELVADGLVVPDGVRADITLPLPEYRHWREAPVRVEEGVVVAGPVSAKTVEDALVIWRVIPEASGTVVYPPASTPRRVVCEPRALYVRTRRRIAVASLHLDWQWESS